MPSSSSAMPKGSVTSRDRQLVVLSLVAIYLAIQLLVPLHHFLYRGGIEWTYADHLFSWRMMVVKQNAGGFFYVTDPNIDQTFPVNPWQFLTTRQRLVMAYLPDMCLQFAKYLAATLPRAGPKPLEVKAQVFVSINGRKPELLIDPNVDPCVRTTNVRSPALVAFYSGTVAASPAYLEKGSRALVRRKLIC